MFQTGNFTIGHFKGAPIRVHWSAPLGALFFGGFAWRPGFWIGFFVLIFFHELGHAVVVKACRQNVVGIDITGIGGVCRWNGMVSQIQRACVAWGGVWAQMIMLVIAYGILALHRPTTALGYDLAAVFTHTNMFLIALNLIPIRPLDGAEAWPLFRLLWIRNQQTKALRQELDWKKPPSRPDKTFGDRVEDPKKADELFNRLMNNRPVEEEQENE